MYGEVKVGDLVYTSHSGVYMISVFDWGSNDPIYMATTLGTDYIGVLCYYNKEHRNIVDLLIEINQEETIVKIVSKHDAQKKLLDK